MLDAFEAYFEAFLRRHARDNPVFAQIAYHFGYLDAGREKPRRGKRLRPRMVLAAAAAHGAPAPATYGACTAIELLHNYSLIHDDIEDSDTLRHGRETIWSRYGLAHGINAGDAVGALAHLALESVEEEAGVSAQAARDMGLDLATANVQMCEGQALDLDAEGAAALHVAAYLEMIGGKTAALFACAGRLGARCAGASEAAVQQASSIGRSFGLGFQIQDDVLGIWGATEHTGKPAGSDIARQKMTYPIVWALENDPSGAGEIIRRAFTRSEAQVPEAQAQEVSELRIALERCGARVAAARAAAQHFDDAADRARDLPPLADFVQQWRERSA
ncbi:MAG TPA: polyprenyl synthetase family protein [Candidatus Tumulicola sp.]|nr:polyprenyl synthetase family protein [Candidatus Tumulicola sp.]